MTSLRLFISCSAQILICQREWNCRVQMYLLGNWLIDMSSEVEEQEVEFVSMWVFFVRCIFTKVRLISTRIILAFLLACLASFSDMIVKLLFKLSQNFIFNAGFLEIEKFDQNIFISMWKPKRFLNNKYLSHLCLLYFYFSIFTYLHVENGKVQSSKVLSSLYTEFLLMINYLWLHTPYT